MHVMDRRRILDSQGLRHPIVHSAFGYIEIGMTYIYRDIVFDQLFIHLAHRCIRLHRFSGR